MDEIKPKWLERLSTFKNAIGRLAEVIVQHAYSMSIIENGEAWLELIDARNSTSHLYDENS